MLLSLFGRQEGAFLDFTMGFMSPGQSHVTKWSRDFVVLTQHQLEPTTSPFNATTTINHDNHRNNNNNNERSDKDNGRAAGTDNGGSSVASRAPGMFFIFYLFCYSNALLGPKRRRRRLLGLQTTKWVSQRPATMKTGPDDVYCVIWAIGMFFYFFIFVFYDC